MSAECRSATRHASKPNFIIHASSKSQKRFSINLHNFRRPKFTTIMRQTIVPFQTLSSHNLWTQYIERTNTVLPSAVDSLVVPAKYNFCFKSKGYDTLSPSLMGGCVYDSLEAFDKVYNTIYKERCIVTLVYCY